MTEDYEQDDDGLTREKCPKCGALAVSYASRVLGAFSLSRDVDGEEFIVSSGDYSLEAHICFACGDVLDIRVAEGEQ